jgi:hypothetical protein
MTLRVRFFCLRSYDSRCNFLRAATTFLLRFGILLVEQGAKLDSRYQG